MPEVRPCWPWQQVSPNVYPILCCPEVRKMPYLTHSLHETSQMVDKVAKACLLQQKCSLHYQHGTHA